MCGQQSYVQYEKDFLSCLVLLTLLPSLLLLLLLLLKSLLMANTITVSEVQVCCAFGILYNVLIQRKEGIRKILIR